MSASRNLGLASAAGEFVTFVDADDRWFPGKLGDQVAIFAREPAVSLVYGTRQLWRSWQRADAAEADSIVDQRIPSDRVYRAPDLFRLTFAERRATNPGSDVIVRRAAALRVGGFEESFRGMYEDQTFLVKIYLREAVFVSSRCWTRYRQHDDSCVAAWSAAAWPPGETDAFERWMEAYASRWADEHPDSRAAVDAALWRRRHPVFARISSWARRTLRAPNELVP